MLFELGAIKATLNFGWSVEKKATLDKTGATIRATHRQKN